MRVARRRGRPPLPSAGGGRRCAGARTSGWALALNLRALPPKKERMHSAGSPRASSIPRGLATMGAAGSEKRVRAPRPRRFLRTCRDSPRTALNRRALSSIRSVSPTTKRDRSVASARSRSRGVTLWRRTFPAIRLAQRRTRINSRERSEYCQHRTRMQCTRTSAALGSPDHEVVVLLVVPGPVQEVQVLPLRAVRSLPRAGRGNGEDNRYTQTTASERG